MINAELYEYLKKDMLAKNKKGNFWSMANKELATDYFEAMKEDYPELVMYKIGGVQFFCLCDVAKQKFLKLVQNLISKKKSELAELQGVLEELKGASE